MSALPIIEIEPEQLSEANLVLKKRSARVDFRDTTMLGKEIEDLRQTLHASKIAVGLSAPQIGLLKRLCIVNITKEKTGEDLVIINPEIKSVSDDLADRYESCMSIPHWKGLVRRPVSIELEFEDQFGNKRSLSATGFMARVIQHEVDHLDGVLYNERLAPGAALEKTDLFLSSTENSREPSK